MAQFTLTIPDQNLPLVIDAFCGTYGYQATLVKNGVSVPNPQTRAAFAKACLPQIVQGVVQDYQGRIESRAALDAARAIDLQITIGA